MTNEEHYERIKQIIDAYGYGEDKEFERLHLTKLKRIQIIVIVALILEVFYVYQDGLIFSINQLIYNLGIILLIALLIYYIRTRNIFQREVNRYTCTESYPDKAIPRYTSFMISFKKRKVLWDTVYYMLALSFYRLGKISVALQFLEGMQDAYRCAVSYLFAEHIKMLVALYYKDYETMVKCAQQAEFLYPKVRHTIWNNKVIGDMKALGAFALAHINGDYQQIYNILKNPKVRPVDEVIRHYYLYLTSLETGDIENAEKYRDYVRANAGTTWYGMAVEEGFSPEPKPENYPGFDIDNETLINAKKTDPKRVIINFVVITMVVVITVVKMISIFIS